MRLLTFIICSTLTSIQPLKAGDTLATKNNTCQNFRIGVSPSLAWSSFPIADLSLNLGYKNHEINVGIIPKNIVNNVYGFCGGYQYLYPLHKNSFLFADADFSLIASSDNPGGPSYAYNYTENNLINASTKDHNIETNFSAGLGYRIYFLKRFSFSISADYLYHQNSRTLRPEYYSYFPSESHETKTTYSQLFQVETNLTFWIYKH